MISRRASRALIVALGGLIVAPAVLFDCVLALRPGVLLAWCFVTLAILSPFLIRQSRRRLVAVPLMVAVFFVGLYLTPWNSRKRSSKISAALNRG